MGFIITFVSIFFTFLGSFKKSKPRRVPSKEDKAKRVKDYPDPYPNGWFNICNTVQVKKGKVIEVDAFGEKLAVFRGENGKVSVVDIFCPHLSANLAEGRVEGNELVCPFHGWKFQQDGKCSHIPYSKNTPPAQAKLKTWEVIEAWGLILVWYHGEGKSSEWNPEFYLPEIANYKYHGVKKDTLHIHLQDFAENGADYAHFNFVHNLLTIPFAHKFVFLKHDVKITFGEGEERHLAQFTDTAKLHWKKSGDQIKDAGGQALVRYFGPGFLIFRLSSKLAHDVTIIKSFTPIGPLELRMEDHIFAPKGTNPFALKYVLSEASEQFHDDILIWERKAYAKKPLLIKEDGPILKMRKWYSQFYSKVGQKQYAVLEENFTEN
ncbi:MAG TPA: Rieske 2Fe-2S domain-containing protein [Chitinophagales bacterium]|nr:Rieske 2Fe-2S domain-containing protein [Chitinophagales bacterium]